MNNASLELGGDNWAAKDGNLLGYAVGDSSGKYVPNEFTFTRGSNLSATRVNADGYIEKGYENTLLGSNDWAQSDSQYEITGGEVGYDGTNDAWLVNKLAAAYFGKGGVSISSVATISIYAKAGSLDKLLVFFAGESARFDLTNVTAVKSGGGTIGQSIELVSGTTDWYRCSLVINVTSSGNLLIKPLNSSNQDVTGTMYIQDAMINQGLAASPYIPTTTTSAQAGVLENTPRLNYTTGVADPYLLLEPSRTNLIPHSELINTSTYYISNNVLEEFAGISPDGSNTAIKVTSTGYTIFRPSAPLTLSTNTTYTFTFYAKNIDASGAWFRVYNASAGNNLVNTTSYFNELTIGEWVRIEYTFTTTATDTLYYPYLQDGNQGGSILYWGTQLEEGSYPTSYIPTYGVSATRAKDAINQQITNLTSVQEGTFFLDFDRGLTTATARDASSDGFFYRSGSSFPATNAIEIATEPDGRARLALRLSSFTSVYLDNALSRYKMLVKWEGSSVKAYVNGALEYSSATKWGDATSALEYIGYNASFRKDVRQLLIYSTALTDAEAITLTTI